MLKFKADAKGQRIDVLPMSESHTHAMMDSCQTDLENLFDPYIRQFTQRRNAFLEREDKMFAEIYAASDDGKTIGVVFVPV